MPSLIDRARDLLGVPNKTFGVKRSPQWDGFRDQWLATHPSCEACGSTQKLEVHHVVPIHVDRTKELDPTNLITLCKARSHNDHLIFGHLLDWHRANPTARQDAPAYRRKVQAA